MRFLILALILGLIIVIFGFIVTNAGTVTDITLWDRPLTDIPLYLVVILSILAGIVTAGIAAVAEGTHIRLENRRLIRQVQKMETEINYLRIQPPVQNREEPDHIQPARSLPGRRDEAPHPPSAPVYGSGDDDDDDDTYTGGTAV